MTEVRAATATDLEAILAVHRAAFGRDAEAGLVRRLVAAGRDTISLVAVDEGDAVLGHVLFSPVTVEEGDDGKALGLALSPCCPGTSAKGLAAP